VLFAMCSAPFTDALTLTINSSTPTLGYVSINDAFKLLASQPSSASQRLLIDVGRTLVLDQSYSISAQSLSITSLADTKIRSTEQDHAIKLNVSERES
jgi:hypothetical protein